MLDNPAHASSDLLNSWKEIAAYLNRGVRTVQRWEADLGLPVHRPRGRGRSAVIAMRSELDSWMQSRPAGKVVFKSNSKLVLASQELRQTVAQARVQHHAALAELVKRLKKMTADLTFNSLTTRDPAA